MLSICDSTKYYQLYLSQGKLSLSILLLTRTLERTGNGNRWWSLIRTFCCGSSSFLAIASCICYGNCCLWCLLARFLSMLPYSGPLLGTSVGGIIFPIILNTLFKEDIGFNWGVRVTAFMILLFLMISNIIMPKAEYRPQAISRPSMISVLKDVPYLASIAGWVHTILLMRILISQNRVH